MLRFTAAVLCLIMAFPILAGGRAVSLIAINFSGPNVRFVELLALAIVTVYTHPVRVPRVRRSTQWLFVGMLTVMVTGIATGVSSGANVTDVFNDARAFATIFLYFPLRRVIVVYRHEDHLLNRVVLGMVMMILVSSIIYFGFPSFVSYLNEGALGARYSRLSVINSFAETLFVSAFLVIAMLYGGQMASAWKVGLLIIVLVAVYVYGFRSILLIFLAQLPLAALIAVLERRWNALRLAKWGLGIGIAGALLYWTGGIGVREDQIERLQSLYGIATQGLQSADQTESVFTRLATFERLYEDVRERPVLGRGFGYIAPMYGYAGQMVEESLVIDNSYLYMLVKTGGLGLGMFVLLLGTLVVRGVVVVLRSGGFWNRVFLLFGASAALSGVTESAIIRSNAGWIIFVLWAVLLEIQTGSVSARGPGALRSASRAGTESAPAGTAAEAVIARTCTAAFGGRA